MKKPNTLDETLSRLCGNDESLTTDPKTLKQLHDDIFFANSSIEELLEGVRYQLLNMNKMADPDRRSSQDVASMLLVLGDALLLAADEADGLNKLERFVSSHS